MIRAIAAMDSKQGIAIGQRTPWNIPADRWRFRELTDGSSVLMGHNTYKRFKNLLRNRRNYVWCRPGTELRDGFEPVYDLQGFLQSFSADLWVIGGGELYAASLEYCTELHITQINADFSCTVFFPPFTDGFQLIEESATKTDNDHVFTYQTWAKQNRLNGR